MPPFTRETAAEKVRLAEDAWNTRDPARVAPACSVDSRWRNRAEIFSGREQIVAFLTRKWHRERGSPRRTGCTGGRSAGGRMLTPV